MSEILAEIDKRRAYRALDERPIPGEVLERVLHAATLAPSCFNNQSWRFIAVTGPEKLKKVKEHLSKGNSWAKKSPCIILTATKVDFDCDLSDGREYALFDTGLAAENLVLQAVKEGLIAHPIAGFSPVPIKEICGIPGDVTLITCIICGYPGDPEELPEEKREGEKAPRSRKPPEEVYTFDSWNFT